MVLHLMKMWHTKAIFGLVLYVFVEINGYEFSLKPQSCERDNKPFPEGNIGESGYFKWLGILRVRIREKRSAQYKIAVTGLVLVKDKYAVANAADVVGIPRHIFRDSSKAYFIAQNGKNWTCTPKSYTTHPEFEYSTFVTIALIELDLGDDESPLRPICWPEYSFNTSNHLYALGYTDEHKLLEKTIYKIQYVNRTLCDEFYNRAEMHSSKYTIPAYYQCGYAINNKDNCIWENGMVLASNSSGHWLLIGFGLRGAGCAGPARFIDMVYYLPWIDTTTDLDEIPDYAYP